MISHQTLQISAVGKVVVPVSASSDSTVLAGFFGHLSGFDAMRTFEAFDGKSGSIWRILHDSGELFLVGLGKEITAGSVYKVLRKFSFTKKEELDTEIGLFIDPALWESDNTGLTAGRFTEMAVNGLLAGKNALRGNTSHPMETLILLSENDNLEVDVLLRAATVGKIIADAQLRAMKLINIPSNHKIPEQFAKMALESAGKFDLLCEVFDEKRLEEEGFELLRAVNRGSEYPARFVVLRYFGAVSPAITLIGKGVTFDSGGLSIKPSESMPAMKCDMGGAATVLAATEAIAALKLPVNLTTVIPLTDNLVDAKSVKPGDIVGSYSGKTVEIIDTDAEGRLILADAIGWAVKNASPDHIIDLATLTGSTVRTFGSHASALFSNHDVLADTIQQAAEESGEKVWPLPLWEEYAEDIKSDVADVRNFSGKPTAGAISAAKFLEYFLDGHTSWAHLDIAGTIFGDTEFGKQRNATGYGVRLLVETVKKLS